MKVKKVCKFHKNNCDISLFIIQNNNLPIFK